MKNKLLVKGFALCVCVCVLILLSFSPSSVWLDIISNKRFCFSISALIFPSLVWLIFFLLFSMQKYIIKLWHLKTFTHRKQLSLANCCCLIDSWFVCLWGFLSVCRRRLTLNHSLPSCCMDFSFGLICLCLVWCGPSDSASGGNGQPSAPAPAASAGGDLMGGTLPLIYTPSCDTPPFLCCPAKYI